MPIGRCGPRDALESLRQRARLELARDRSRGWGRSQPEAVVEAWEMCLLHDPASEEAASALMRVYAAQGNRHMVSSTYERCRDALESLGLRPSPALEEARQATMGTDRSVAGRIGSPPAVTGWSRHWKQERRLVSVLFAELSGPAGMGRGADPEDLRQVVGGALAGVIAEVEGLGGTVTSVSGAGLVALFGAPEAHEDDPERAVRAAFGRISAIGARGQAPGTGELSVRAGIETGPAVVGPLGTGSGLDYGAVGEVVATAAALQSAAKGGLGPGRARPPARPPRGSSSGGRHEEVVPPPSAAKPVVAPYLERPKARPAQLPRLIAGWRARRPWSAAKRSWQLLDEALRDATSGTGSVVFVVGEPGLGKTRLVQECRKRFMAWVGAGTGRLPLWLEGRCASYCVVDTLTVCTNSSCRPGWASPPRRARTKSAQPWSGR